MCGELGALVMGASSRCRDPRTRADPGWTPQHADMVSTVGDPDLRRLAEHPS